MKLIKIKILLMIVITGLINFLKKKKNEKKTIILLYHSLGNKVDDDHNGLYNLSLDKFLFQIDYLKKNNFKFKHFKDLNFEENEVVVTFDDGYSSVYKVVKNEIIFFPITIFLTSNFVKSQNPNYMNEKQIKEVSQLDFVEFGSHSISHSNLNKLDTSNLNNEIYKSKKFLEKLINKKINLFSYPYGKFNLKIMNMIKKAGYKASFTSNYGSILKKSNKFKLNRIDIWSIDNSVSFSQKINLHWKWFYYFKKSK